MIIPRSLSVQRFACYSLTVMTATIGIVGASVRGASESAHRGGFRVLGADQFADRDCPGEIQKIETLGQFEDWFRILETSVPPIPWMYTGGLENQPRLVERLSRNSMLLGASAATLRRVRDPLALHLALRGAGFQTPAVVTALGEQSIMESSPGTGEMRWLRKPRLSAGGRFIVPWKRADPFDPGRHYLQEFVPGMPISAAFLGGLGACELIGVFKAVSGIDELGAQPFWYRGSVGPLAQSSIEVANWIALGAFLHKAFSLRGLFGVDCVMTRSGPCVLEVNPRFTASMELLDRVDGGSVVGRHVRACLGAPLDDRGLCDRRDRQMTERIHAKAVLYATRPTTIPDHLSALWLKGDASAGCCPCRMIADVPFPATVLGTGTPIVTVFATGESQFAALNALTCRVREVRFAIDVAVHP